VASGEWRVDYNYISEVTQKMVHSDNILARIFHRVSYRGRASGRGYKFGSVASLDFGVFRACHLYCRHCHHRPPQSGGERTLLR